MWLSKCFSSWDRQFSFQLERIFFRTQTGTTNWDTKLSHDTYLGKIEMALCKRQVFSWVCRTEAPQTQLHPAGYQPQPPAPFTWAGEQPNAQEKHKVWPAVNPCAINHEVNAVWGTHIHRGNMYISHTPTLKFSHFSVLKMLLLHWDRYSALCVQSQVMHVTGLVNMCEVASRCGCDWLPLMDYFHSKWEVHQNTHLATDQTASQVTLIYIDSRQGEANEKLIKRKYVLTRGASGVLLYTHGPDRYL